jgi:nucleotide-binding universal stress UspA family protein
VTDGSLVPPDAGRAEGGTRLGRDGGAADRTLSFLVCVGGGPESRDTLRFAVRIVKALGGDVAILYVARPIPQAVRDEVLLSRQKMGEWETDLPGIAFLRHARDLLRDEGLLRLDEQGRPIVRHALRSDVAGAFEIELQGAFGDRVRFRIREGQIAEEIRSEVRQDRYDLLVIGAGTNRRLQHQIAQFVDLSTLFVKNIRPEPYRFLLCTGGERAGPQVAQFTARAALALDVPVDVLSVTELRQRRGEAEEWVRRLAAILEERGVETRTLVRQGPIVQTIVETAGEDHVIVIGRSNESELRKFFFGSRPIRVIQRARCPVLHVT